MNIIKIAKIQISDKDFGKVHTRFSRVSCPLFKCQISYIILSNSHYVCLPFAILQTTPHDDDHRNDQKDKQQDEKHCHHYAYKERTTQATHRCSNGLEIGVRRVSHFITTPLSHTPISVGVVKYWGVWQVGKYW